jgi:hypothetical protein
MTTEVDLDPGHVREKVATAFDVGSYPGDDHLVRGVDRESLEVAAAFRGKEWQHLGTSFVRENKEALPLLSEDAFRYYIPAYLVACLDDRSGIDVAWDSVIFLLTPGKTPDAWFLARARGFSPSQVEAIVCFLEFQYASEKIAWEGDEPPQEFERALRYWRERSTTEATLGS